VIAAAVGLAHVAGAAVAVVAIAGRLAPRCDIWGDVWGDIYPNVRRDIGSAIGAVGHVWSGDITLDISYIVAYIRQLRVRRAAICGVFWA
jgi:hypothetical protein